MEVLKDRTESKELKKMRCLQLRVDLDLEARNYYFRLEKGFEGEKNCDALLEANLSGGKIMLQDLLFEVNHTTFQIDTLIISQENIFPLEVKNNEGDHFYRAPEFYKTPEKIIKNPLDQLKRSESLFRQLLHQHGLNFPVKGYAVFINPKFTLYQAPMNQPIFYPTQLDKMVAMLNTKSNLTDKHYRLAEKLLSLHLKDSPYSKVPKYDFEQLKKGTYCPSCYSFSVYEAGHHLECENCGSVENIESAVLRNVEELLLLFPDKRITTNIIYEWIGIVNNKKRIQNVLRRHYTRVGKGRYSFYIK